MVQVVEYEEFKKLSDRFDRLENEIEFWKTLFTAKRYLSRLQTMEALGCSSMTLNRLTKMNVLVYEKKGRKIRYCVDSVRNYLTVKKIDQTYVDRRIAKAMNTGI